MINYSFLIEYARFLKEDYIDQCFSFCIVAIHLFDVDSTFALRAEYSKIFVFTTDIVIYDDYVVLNN